MDKMFRYREKHVHDIPVGQSFVRLWSWGGTSNSSMIIKSFQHLMKTPFVYPYVALMPDFHPGEGTMIGSVIPTKDVLLPTVIGNDIGCGMTTVKLPVMADEISSKLYELRNLLQEKVPTGSTSNSIISERVEKNIIWGKGILASSITGRNWKKLIRQFASLGGGNHFLEIQEDQEGYVWIMIHSGSRYLGVLVHDHYIAEGKKQFDVDQNIYSKLPYLVAGSEAASNYLSDLNYTIEFARESRKEMMHRVLEVFSTLVPSVKVSNRTDLMGTAFDVVHNYISMEDHFGEKLFIHRKGAIRVNKGEVGIVPGSMGTTSYVVEGRGNEFSFCTCSHGAGRAMSRGDAFRKISDRDFKESMRNIICEDIKDIKDEAPQAYKDIHCVMRGQKDIIKTISELKPIVSIKGCH